jgi:uncharacterized repeat protein (TIGR01451 family)
MNPFQTDRPQPATRRKHSTRFALLLVCNLLILLVQPAFADGLTAQLATPGPGPTTEQLGRISKSASKGILTLGEMMSYTIHLEVGWNASLLVQVSDPLPPRLDYVPGSANHGGVYDPATRSLSWAGITVTPDVPVNLMFEVKMTGPVVRPTPTVNVATISWNGFVLQRQAWVTLLPEPASGLGLLGSFKSAEPRLLGPGEKVVYSIHLLNNGPSAATVAVTDPLPPMLTYVDGSVSYGGVYDPAARTVAWKEVLVPPYNPLLPVEPVTLSFAALAPDIFPASSRPLVVTNTAEIATDNLAFKRSVDILLVTHPISPLEGSFKTASQRVVVPGQVFTYTIQLHNSSPVPIPAVVRDAVPTQVRYVEGSANADGTYDAATRTLTWDNLTVPEGSSLTLTFAVTALGPIVNSLKIVNTAYISACGITLMRSVPVLLSLTPGGDTQPPVVHSLTIDRQDVLTQSDVILHIVATDNVAVKLMFIKEWFLATTPYPHWQEVRASGWIPFQADTPWRLTGESGTHFVGVWVADAALNRSRLTRSAIDFASLLLPRTHVAQRGMVPYLVYYPASTEVTATLMTLSGAAHLFVWHPANMFAPDQISPTPASDTQTITFRTPTAGIYLFLVYGLRASVFDLSITPGGGPRIPPNLTPSATSAGLAMDTPVLDPTMIEDDMSANPILPQSGQDPLNFAQEPGGPFFETYLPTLRR